MKLNPNEPSLLIGKQIESFRLLDNKLIHVESTFYKNAKALLLLTIDHLEQCVERWDGDFDSDYTELRNTLTRLYLAVW